MDRLGVVVFVTGSRCVWRPCSRAVRSMCRSINAFSASPTLNLHRSESLASLSTWALTGQSPLQQRCLHVSSLCRVADKLPQVMLCQYFNICAGYVARGLRQHVTTSGWMWSRSQTTPIVCHIFMYAQVY